MKNLEKAIDRIRVIECPTGELENRMVSILEGLNVANRNEITIKRDEQFDKIGSEAYSVRITGSEEQRFTVIAKSGFDDYVAEVIDAYIN